MISAKKIICSLLLTGGIVTSSVCAQETSLVNNSQSPYVKLTGLNMTDVQWTDGFWADRFEVCKDTMVPFMWSVLNNPDVSHSFRNFEIAAGLETGSHDGPPFHDGDFYKWFEAAAMVYSVTKDKELDELMDKIITTIGEAQREDGYIHTPVNIEQRKHPENISEFAERLDFETYNLGHLMTAGCVHYRATGKKNLLDIAVKATEYLYNFYKKASPELARNAICPSHYMGVMEMYRTTREPRYLELAENLVEIRNLVENGADHNQDRIPFREQDKAEGHAVRANYLYAGVADVIAETGDTTLMKPLENIWKDLVYRKMYITGACGALYDGVSPDGTTYDQPIIQQVHQAYGRDYQLPNMTAHNESCANIGNMMWNWRMLELTGDCKYADIVETTLYNSILSAVSLDGKRFFYTNPLCVNHDLLYTLRWSKDREEYISLCNCCPPNVVRTVAEVSNYMYSIGDNALWCHLYSGNHLDTKTKEGSSLILNQKTDYPWDGRILLEIQKAPKSEYAINLRIPSWCDEAHVKINGKVWDGTAKPGTYATVTGKWKKGDIVELELPMRAKLMAANPLVEESRNQVAVQRGPVVYCLESPDYDASTSIFDIAVPANIDLKPQKIQMENSEITVLVGTGVLNKKQDWNNSLYQEIGGEEKMQFPVRFIPYYAWNNRGASDMTVWVPVIR